jgi:hypothetical protein
LIVKALTKADLVEAIVLKYAENNANTLSPAVRTQLRQEILTVLYQVSAQSHPVINVIDECRKLGVEPPKLKPCPFCGKAAVYAVSQARFLKPELVNLYLVAGCRSCGITCQMFKIGDDLLGACELAAEKWNHRIGGDA